MKKKKQETMYMILSFYIFTDGDDTIVIIFFNKMDPSPLPFNGKYKNIMSIIENDSSLSQYVRKSGKTIGIRKSKIINNT